MPVLAHVSPTALQLTAQPPQYAFVRRSRQVPPQQRSHVPPHDVPLGTERVQLRLSVKFWFAQPPVTHRRSVRVLDCVPVVSHALLNPPQVPHAVYVVVPQLLPSVSRLHDRLSLDVTVVHEPAAHVGVMTERLCVPVSSHVLA